MLEPGKLTAEEALNILAHHYHRSIFEDGLLLAVAAFADPNAHVAPAWIKEYEYSLTPEGQQRFNTDCLTATQAREKDTP